MAYRFGDTKAADGVRRRNVTDGDLSMDPVLLVALHKGRLDQAPSLDYQDHG